MANNGHIFEQEFKKSVPAGVYVKKLKVMSGYRGGGNEGDFLLFKYPNLYIFELKSHKGASIPFDVVRDKQLVGLFNNSHIKGCKCGFIFNFRDYEETYFVEIRDILDYMESCGRKSFPLSWVKELGIKIEGKKIRTRYRYNLEKFLEVVEKI